MSRLRGDSGSFRQGAALAARGEWWPGDLIHPELEYHEDPRWPGSGVYRGQNAIQARFDEYLEILGPVEMRLCDLLDRGDVVVLVFDTRGKSLPSGLPFDHKWAYVWTFRDGRLIEWRAYFEEDEALKAVGLSG